VTPDTGLVYASSAPRAGRVRALQRGPRRQAVPARPAAAAAAAGAAPAGPAAASPERAAAGAAGPRGAAARAAAAAAAAVSTAEGWAPVNAPADGLPLSAVGALDMVDTAGWWVGCTGAMFAPHALVTAAVRRAPGVGLGRQWAGGPGAQRRLQCQDCLPLAHARSFSHPAPPCPHSPPQHCVFDRADGAVLASGRFAANAHCSRRGCAWTDVARPFGDAPLLYYETLSGWARRGGGGSGRGGGGSGGGGGGAWFSDLAVVTLAEDLGTRTGMLGVRAAGRAGQGAAGKDQRLSSGLHARVGVPPQPPPAASSLMPPTPRLFTPSPP
jgi:hypothetical protein